MCFYKMIGAVLVAVMMGCGFMPAGASADDWDRLREAASTIKSVSAGFTQEKQLRIMNRPLVSQGRFTFRAPGYLKWEYLSPIHSVMTMDRGSVSMRVESNGQWSSGDAGGATRMRQVIMDEISGWLSGRFQETAGFTPRLSSGPPVVVTLTPKGGMGQFVQYIRLTFSSEPGIIQTVEMVEDASTKTRITFHNVQVERK